MKDLTKRFIIIANHISTMSKPESFKINHIGYIVITWITLIIIDAITYALVGKGLTIYESLEAWQQVFIDNIIIAFFFQIYFYPIILLFGIWDDPDKTAGIFLMLVHFFNYYVTFKIYLDYKSKKQDD